MKKYYIITSILFFIAMILAGIGFANGGLQNITFKDGKIQIYKNDRADSVQNVSEFKKLNINVLDDDVRIVYGDKYSVETTAIDKKEIKIIQTKDTLEITQETQNMESGLVFDDVRSGQIEITIPRDYKLDKVTIDSQDGDIAINDEITSLLKLSASDAEVHLSNVDLRDGSTLNVEDGDISFRNSKIKNVIIGSNDGEVRLQQTEVLGRGNKVIVQDGDISVYQLNDFGFNAVSAGDGDIEYQGTEYHGHFKHNESSANFINLITNDGDINIH